MKSQTMRMILALLTAWNVIFYVDHGNGINLGIAIFSGIVAVMPWQYRNGGNNDESGDK